jgi:secretion/DNA translocation related TadE-like protein
VIHPQSTWSWRRQRGSVSEVVAAVLVLALVLSIGVAEVARVLVGRSHARTAADAAALAVAQELALPTGTDPAEIAAGYAERNGADLTGCDCEAGSLEATVTVSVLVEGFLLVTGVRTVTARARAVVDLPTPSPSP